jgi:divalent metal cation (Fe/Co/Zn/Cd) transporter
MGWKLAVASVKELLETSLPKDITKNIMKMVAETPGVLAYHRFRSRRNGSRMIIEFHIKVNPMLTVVEGHDIATNIEHKIKQAYGDVLVTVHVEPYLK